MKVFGWSNDPKPWTNPYPEADTDDGIPGEDGFIWALRGGDMMSPWGWQPRPETTTGAKLNFFNAIPTRTRRLYFAWPILPFFAYRKGRFGFYVGFKVFGVDSDKYKDFPGVHPSEVYPESSPGADDGSQALGGFTWRFTTNLKKAA